MLTSVVLKDGGDSIRVGETRRALPSARPIRDPVAVTKASRGCSEVGPLRMDISRRTAVSNDNSFFR